MDKEAMILLINCLLSLGVATGMNDKFNRDLWRAAELLGISKLDLLRGTALKAEKKDD